MCMCVCYSCVARVRFHQLLLCQYKDDLIVIRDTRTYLTSQWTKLEKCLPFCLLPLNQRLRETGLSFIRIKSPILQLQVVRAAAISRLGCVTKFEGKMMWLSL